MYLVFILGYVETQGRGKTRHFQQTLVYYLIYYDTYTIIDKSPDINHTHSPVHISIAFKELIKDKKTPTSKNTMQGRNSISNNFS